MTDLREPLDRASKLVSNPADPYGRLVARRTRKRRNERLTAGFVALVVVGAAIGVTAAALHSTSRHRRTTGSGSSAPALQPGQYLYRQETIQPGPDDPNGVVIQTWWATDDSGRVTDVCPDPCNYGVDAGTFGPGKFPGDSDVSGLSTDPDVLFDQMIQRTSPSGSSPEPAFSPGPELASGVTAGSLRVAVQELLMDPNGSPDLRAALFEVAQRIPGMEVTEGTTDPSGRPATKLSFELPRLPGEPGGTWELYFDQASGQMMAERFVAAPGAASPGGMVFNEGIVDSIDVVPTGDQWLFPPAPVPSP
jgi:hypothetical protein